MNKFKVGDVVKRIALNTDWIKIGSEWVVKSVDESNNTFTVVGLDNAWWHPKHFELVSDEDVLKRTLMNSGDGGVVVGVETNTLQDESVDQFFESDIILPKTDEDDFTCCLGKGIESDGGSSSYYFTKLPKHLIDQIVETGGIEIKDIIRYVFDNDADAFNIVKAQKRIIEALKGKGKAGITPLYDAKKITFFANEQYEAMKNKESK